MTSTKLIKALRDAAMYINYVAPNCYASIEAKEAIRAAADALEAAEKRIAELERQHGEQLTRNVMLVAQLPKEGEWITTRTEYHDGEIYCSVCNHDAPTEGDYRQVKTNYCPNCGARMKGEQE